MALPFGIFWVMLYLTRHELGWKWGIICALLAAGFLAMSLLLPTLWVVGVIGQVVLDVVLILVLFGGDIRIG
jgi:uncharacterized protein (DUF849 family)